MQNLKIFISWSKPTSLRIARALRNWLPLVFPDVEFFISEEILIGSRWQTEIGKALHECNFAIICVTPQNAAEPWLLFEAGALSKALGTAVVPYCFDIQPGRLPQPLSQFQGCMADETGTRRMIRAINGLAGGTLHPSHEALVFEKYWRELEQTLTVLKSGADGNEQDFSFFFGQSEAAYPAVFLDGHLEPVKDENGNDTPLGRVKAAPMTDDRGKSIVALPKGVRQIVPYQELRSVYKLRQEFEKFGRNLEICLESEHGSLPEEGCVSMGLGFNKMTRKLASLSHIYSVLYTETVPGVSGYTTDDFIIAPDDGPPIVPRDVMGDDGLEWALLARVLVNRGPLGLVPYFVCAGHTADGTAAACNYLAQRWGALCRNNRENIKERHMAVVVTHPKDDRECEQKIIGPYFRLQKKESAATL